MLFDFTTPKGLKITPSDEQINKTENRGKEKKRKEKKDKRVEGKRLIFLLIFISSTLEISSEKKTRQKHFSRARFL